MKYAFTTDTTLSPKITTSKGSNENELFFEFNRLAVEQGILGSQFKEKATMLKRMRRLRKN